jgi:two-component system sensor histidine kinase BaeS
MRAGRVRFGTLGWRLLAAFLLVGVVPVVVVATAAGVSVNRSTATLIDDQRAQLRSQVASALAVAYASGRGSWQRSQLTGVQSLATAHGMNVVVRDNAGRQVAAVGSEHEGDGHPTGGSPSLPHPVATPSPVPMHSSDTMHQSSTVASPEPSHHVDGQSVSPMPSQPHTPEASHDGYSYPGTMSAADATPAIVLMVTSSPLPAAVDAATMTVPVVVGGKQVGTATLTLPATVDAAVEGARSALLNTITVAALAAVLLAVVAALLVSRRVSRPLVALAAATRAFAAGDPNPERLIRPAPGELGEVGGAFVAMAAALKKEDELRRNVTADVAHELRTPVTILRGQTEQLLDGIADEVLRLERVTDDLATLSAADAAGLSLRTALVDLADLGRQAVDAMRAQFDDAELDATCDVHDPVVVQGDATRLTQVITNLLTNAVKFTPPGGTVAVAVHRSGDEALLTVTDTGPGITPEDLPHIFDRFYRGHAARTRHGTGIGLSVAQSLVAAHGGTVTASRPPAGGTQFAVRLPLGGSPGA